MATNDMTFLNPPRVTKPTYKMYHQTRWEKEKAAAGSPDAFEYPDDPKLIGPWIIGETVGKGASGRVKIARHKSTGRLAAVKILPAGIVARSRNSLVKAEKHRMGIEREIVMMKLMEHPNIMRLYDVWEGEKELFLILEWIEGGELFDLIVNRGRLPPLEALAYFKQIIHGLSYCHAFSISHRDLKPENILIHGSKNELVKIADWGMAAFQSPYAQLETSCGSPHYASPEIIRGERYEGAKADIWSVGVVLFALVAGKLPFDDKHVPHLLSKVKSGKFEMPSYVYPEAADLIQRMLVVDVHKRITMPEILSHPFFLRDTPGIYYTPPPTVSALQTSLFSADDIDQDVLSSLRIIFGKHASRAVILHELLQVTPNCAKAFYVLLLKFRDRQMENFNGDHDDADSKTGPHPYHSPRFQPADHPTVLATVLSPQEPAPLLNVARPTHTRTRSSPSKHRSAPVDMRSHLPAIPGARPRLPLIPVPSYATATNVSKSRESALSSPKLPSDTTSPMPHSPAPPYEATVSTPILTRPGRKRRETTSITESLGLNIGSPICLGTTGLPARSKSRKRDASPGSRRPSLGLGITAPVHPTHPGPTRTLPLAIASHKLYPVQGSPSVTPPLSAVRVRRATSPAPSTIISPTTASHPTMEPFIPLKSPRMFDPDTQSAMDDLVSQANVLGALDNAAHIERDHTTHQVSQSPAILQEVQKLSKGSAGDCQTSSVFGQPDHSCPRPSHHSVTQEKENNHVAVPLRGRAGGEGTKRTPGSLKNPILGRSYQASERTGCVTVAEEKENVTVKETKRNRADSEGASKRGMVRKSRPAALDLGPTTPLFSVRPAFHVTSPTSTPVMPLFSPIVGEFRGWFSNLFNWKAPTYILHSHNNYVITRDETIRLLEDFGVSVIVEESHGYGVLRCKVDDLTDVNGIVTQKQVRFRVEFQPFRTPIPLSPASDNPGRAISLAPFQPGMPFTCTLTLVQEKGALSTFRAVYQSLRSEWKLDALQSPIAGILPSANHQSLITENGNDFVLVQ